MAKLNKILIILFAFLLIGFSARPVFALDESGEYPSLMWGPTTVIENPGTSWQMIFYSQTEGNEILRNVVAASDVSPSLIFQNTLFALSGNLPGSLKLLNSRTYVNGDVKISTAVLRQTGVNVFGDSVNAGNTYNYWGQHLSQNSGPVNSNALWQQQNYSFNKDTQAYWNSGKNQAMSDAIARLMQNATKLQTAAISSSFDGVCWNLADKCSQLDQYPDGRVWYWNGPVSIGGGINYSKKATIVVNNGDLTINGNLLSTDQISSLGFIVESGNAIIQNETNPHKKISINASFFVPKGTIQIIGNDIDLTGSFVADDFNVSGSDINFIQDTRGESAWPPGFRDLQSLASISK